MVNKKVMNDTLIIAQKETWGKLVKISDSGNIGSAYLFSGSKGSGKEGLALKFAQLLNCQGSNIEICFKCESCIRFSTLQHERLNIIVPLPTPKDNKTDSGNKNFIPQDYIKSIKQKSSDPFYKILIPKAKRILIQSIRDLKKTLYLKQDSNSGRNIVIIFNSELLCSGQGESGNALLKVLEEPPENTTIILTTDYKKMLFETIISRCQAIDIPMLPNDYIFEWLLKRKVKEKDANFLVSICRGNIHQAKALSNQPINKIISTIEKISTTLINQNPDQWRRFIDHYSRLCVSDQLEFSYHINLISLWFKGVNKHRQGLKSDFDDTNLHSQIVSFSKTYPTANIYAIVLCLEDVMKSVSQNLYMPLIILNLILDIQKHIHE
ncbi:MAG: hypothetical protein VX530_04290 [Candidatus Neomarinimicrobiota bacterium]|nr:hypothetical protein [Candidatus Neomarinimicrobiota bacterium]